MRPQAMLARAGISRLALNAVHVLATLAEEEAMEAILRFLRDCRVETDEGLAADWAEVIAERSEAWPQFVRTEMAAFAGGLVTSQGVLADVDREAVRLRNTSYRARRGDELREAQNLVAAVLADVPPEGIDPARVLAAIRRHARPATAATHGTGPVTGPHDSQGRPPDAGRRRSRLPDTEFPDMAGKAGRAALLMLQNRLTRSAGQTEFPVPEVSITT